MTSLFPDSKQQLFDRWAPTYDWLFPSVFYQAIHKRLLDYIELPDHPHILDLGCGTGRLLDRLATQFVDLSGIGLDFSAKMIQQANQCNRYPSRLTYLQANAESLPFADQQFDSVFNTISFLHYLDPQPVLTEVRRVLRPGGHFYLVDFTTRWATAPQRIGISPNSSVWFYSPAVREQLAHQAGFSLVAHHYLLGPVLLTVFKKYSDSK